MIQEVVSHVINDNINDYKIDQTSGKQTAACVSVNFESKQLLLSKKFVKIFY